MSSAGSLYIGLISGTSVDAIDSVVLDAERAPPAVIASRSHPIPPELRAEALALAAVAETDPERVWRLDVALGELFAEAAGALLAHAGLLACEVRAIGSHGQTVRHRPRARPPFSAQLGDPGVIAERTGITTVADFRRRDLAAGGEGAPLAPAFHAAALAPDADGDAGGTDRVVVNLGGIANATLLPGDAARPVIGFDTGPANALLDLWASRHLSAPMDRNARWAETGTVHETLLARLLEDEFFAAPPPKSTGREHFDGAWLDARLASVGPPPPPADVQRTLCALTVRTVADAVAARAAADAEVLVCGGGVHNPMLMAGLGEALAPRTVRSTAERGVDPDWVEAATFAWLAARTLAGLPGNVPSVTGARREVVLGGIYPA